ncbi:MAG TPA: pitrilysin family protein [Bacteroidia bacterium]|jgi:predicted Zn-dependent peptidase
MTDRKIAPPVNEIANVEIIRASEKKLRNGIPVFTVNAGTQDLVRIELVFKAGFTAQSAPLIATTANELIDEGTAKFNAQQIADKVDYFGAFLETEVTQDYATIAIFTLNKYLKEVLPVLEEIIKNAEFPEKELTVNLNNRRQKFVVSSQKVADMARKKFNQLLFGNKHPYGYFVELRDYDKVEREAVKSFHREKYVSGNCAIIVSGKIGLETVDLLDKHFGGTDWPGPADKKNENNYSFHATTLRENLVLKEDALQSAIRIGRVMFNKTHPDYLPMLVLSTVLGGYFGSRLMSNIREDKGYTYGIGCAMVSLKEAGYFFIGTEVGVDVTQKALDEIYYELKRLREEPVGEDELMLVRNYLLGSFLGSVDGPFALADRFKGIMMYNLGYDYYDRYISTIRNIKPERLLELAQQYFKQEDLIELVAGRK